VGPTQPTIQWVPGSLTWRKSGRSAKLTIHLHLVPTPKNAWSYTSTPQYALMVWCSVKKQSTRTTSTF